jgi:hypothetical protein
LTRAAQALAPREGGQGDLLKRTIVTDSDNYFRSQIQNTPFWNPTKIVDHEKEEGLQLWEEILGFSA